ncbi:MAG: DUF6788 family protein [Nitrososphaerales archaeon]
MASRLERYEEKYRSLTATLGSLGFVSPGSLVLRETSCGKSGCKCQGDPPRLHGPYYQWSRVVDGKTVSRRLTEAQAELYEKWIANRRLLKRIVEEMEEVSAEAGEILLRQAAEGPANTGR